MKAFASLYQELDRTNSTNSKKNLLREYFRRAEPKDAAWAVLILAGHRQKRLIGPAQLREWLTELSGYPHWLVEHCYAHVGDLAETVALLLASKSGDIEWADIGLAGLMKEVIQLRSADAEDKEHWVKNRWLAASKDDCFVMTKLLTGALRVGVSKTMVAKSLAEEYSLEPGLVQRRLMGEWQPTANSFLSLISPDDGGFESSQPYPFFLASALEGEPEHLGEVKDWLVEWKWDGIRCQLVKRAGEVWLWSRGEELIMDTFPEIARAGISLPDGTVLDGEILAWQSKAADNEGYPMNFNQLQRRLGRKKVGKKLLSEVPAKLLAFDLLEYQGKDIRDEATNRRTDMLAKLLQSTSTETIVISPHQHGSWQQLSELRQTSRQRGVEGFILKRANGPYQVGRVRGDWWKWKVDPYSVDAVLIYAQAGHGRRSNLYTDYTFAVWQDKELVPIAKAYSGLTDKEIQELDRWIRKHTRDRFGPVRSVDPENVFELAFEGIAASSRHKSGIAVRFPRIRRWRRDKKANEADTLQRVKELIPSADH